MGKPITQALHDVARSSWNVRFLADHALMSMVDTYIWARLALEAGIPPAGTDF
jgi:hypothetical protein